LNEPSDRTVHVSLSGSGCLEQSRPDGGKGAFMAQLARDICNVAVKIEDLKQVVGLHDCFGEQVVLIDCAAYAVRKINEDQRILWGDLLYTPFVELVRRNLTEEQVPFGLAKVLMLAA